MATLDTAAVTPAPSGEYGFYVPSHKRVGSHGPVVQIAQVSDGVWYGTPAQHHATSVATSTTSRWSIDYGQSWKLDRDDTEAFKDFARLMLMLAEVSA